MGAAADRAANGARPVRMRCQAATVAGIRVMIRHALRRFASRSLARDVPVDAGRERDGGTERVERMAVARQALEQLTDRRGQGTRLLQPRRELP